MSEPKEGAMASLYSSISERFPSLLTGRTGSIHKGKFSKEVEKANNLLGAWATMLDGMSEAERDDYFRSPDTAAAAAAAAAGDDESVGCGGDDQYDDDFGRQMTQQDHRFQTAASAFALQDQVQIGNVKRLLMHASAICQQCRDPSKSVGVLCMCRSLCGDLLCYGCDDDRHQKCPCARTRYVLVNIRLGQDQKLATVRQLTANQYVRPSGNVNSPVAEQAWITSRGSH